MSTRDQVIRVLNWGSSAVLVLLVLAIFAVVLAPQFTGWRYGILRSGSMSPAMSTGAAIVVAPVDSGDVRPGDVITFRSKVNKDLLITHRVVELTEDGGRMAFRTQGDANDTPDAALVSPNQIVGRVVYDVPKVGLIARYLNNQVGFFLLIALPAALIIGMESRELVAGVKDYMRSKRTERGLTDG